MPSRFGRNRYTSLIGEYVREQKVSILAWVLVGSLAQYGEALALNKEIRNFPGGAANLAKILQPAIESMRPLRWPADRLDTLAGYLSYHNITLIIAFLCLFGVVQGSKAVRGYEDSHAMELVLATGASRSRALVARSLGFAATISIISLGLGIGTGLSMAACDQPNWYGSILIFLAGGFAAYLSFAIALLVSQFSRTYRSASGTVAIVLVILYIINNVAEKIGVIGKLRYLAPTYYANLSRPLIPGFDTNWSSIGFVGAVSILLIFVSTKFFMQRDIGAGLLHRSEPATKLENDNSEFHPRIFWASNIKRGWVALLSWTLSTAAFTALMISLEPSVAKDWELYKWLGVSTGLDFEKSMQVQYIALCASLIPPFISGYVIQQSSNWINDLKQGRLELYLSTPLSWRKLILERIAASTAGGIVIASITVAVIAAGSAMIDLPLDAFGIFRVWVMSLACAISMSVIACITVALIPRREAVVALATYVTVSYVVSYIAGILGWSVWIERLSIFYAFGSPYTDWPGLLNAAIITVMIVPGFFVAVLLANRSPKTA